LTTEKKRLEEKRDPQQIFLNNFTAGYMIQMQHLITLSTSSTSLIQDSVTTEHLTVTQKFLAPYSAEREVKTEYTVEQTQY
jgi:hypothetical protein